MGWKTIAIFAPIFFVSYQALAKLWPKQLSVFLLNSIASIVGAIVMFVIFLATEKSTAQITQMDGKQWLIAAGIGTFIAFGNFAIIKAFTLGATQSGFTALFNPSYIVIGLVFGLLFWQERITWPQIVGTLLAIGGILLIAFFKK